MLESFRILRVAYRIGKLHRKLIIRITILIGIVLFTTLVLLYDVFLRNLPLLPVIICSVLGMLFGYFVMSKMRTVTWHEHEAVLTMAGLDVVGLLILILYGAIQIVARRYLSEEYQDAFHISGYALALFWGIMFGRLQGIVQRIETLFRTENG